MPLSDTLPAFVRRHLERRDTLRRVLDNSSWLFGEHVLRMTAGLLVGIWMARYLGPESYGWLNYALAVVGIVGSFTGFGINAVVVRELVRTPSESSALLGTAFYLRAVGAAVGLLACVVIASRQTAPSNSLILIVAAAMIFQVSDVADLLFQSRGESSVSAKIRMAACVLANLLKVALLVFGAPLWAFAAAGVFEIALASIGWWWAARHRAMGITTWYTERQRLRALLHQSWPLAISGLAISAQAYADQLVLGALAGGEELGQYAAALRVVSIFSFIPMVIQTVASPEITRAHLDDERLYQRRLHSLYRTMFGLFLVTAVPLTLLGPPAARLLYGVSYAGTSVLLPWLALRLFFTNFGVARSIFITNEGMFRFALFTAVVGGLVNVLLNIALVPGYGAHGAIVSSLASFAITTFGLEFFHPRARSNLRLMMRAVFLPWRRLPE